jgi:hypothetical protein
MALLNIQINEDQEMTEMSELIFRKRISISFMIGLLRIYLQLPIRAY